ncbi:HEAT repeat domain-containing protein [Alienimonas sp. DA493]|uniref:HEAT repeat domain-containing protein n=1 Tax=Alienimonas sp. DA493 TaxID=3373605 RepID=UPI003754684E
MFGSTRPLVAALALIAAALPSPASADVVVLKAGGEVRGEFVGDPSRGDAVAVRTHAGATVRVPRSEVREWAYRDAGREAFERRFDRTPDDPDAWWALAEWALENRLRPERDRALRELLKFDPDHEPARLALGHRLDHGDWLTPAQWRRRNGLVLYGRRAVSPEEKALLEAADAREAAEKQWFRQARLWQRALSDPERAGAARAEMVRVTDPTAIPALRQFFADVDDVHVRMLYVQVLSRMPETAPVPALAAQAMGDVDDLVREQAVRALAEETAPRDGPARAGAAQPLLRDGLRSDANVTVRRAAAALGELGDANAVPDLIRSLITTHRYKIAVPDTSGAGVSMSPNGAVAGGLGANAAGGLSPEALLAIRAQYPTAIVRPGASPVTRTRRVTVEVEHRNPEVLAALQAIVARTAPADGLGVAPPATYDEALWAAWWERNRATFAAL